MKPLQNLCLGVLRVLSVFLVAAGVLLFAFALTGCTSTVVPTPAPISKTASWDGVTQNSGVIRYDEALGGFVVTERFVARYDALVDLYGDAKDSVTRLPYFVPDLEKRHGITRHGDEWVMNPEAMTAFVKMNRWKKAGRSPQ